jgi:hypothetical protein
MLNTYCITKPDGNLYEFTAELQKLPTAPTYFTFKGHDGAKDVVIEISPLLMKTMLGFFVVATKDGEVLVETPSHKIDAKDTKLQLKAEREFKSEDFPLAISYNDSRKVPVFTYELSEEQFKKY